MVLTLKQRIAAWAILAVCLLSVPLTMLVHRQAPAETAEEGDGLESLLHGPKKDRLLVVRLSGMIADRETNPLLSSLGTAAAAGRELKKALADTHVRAVLLRINSPGGTVATSQELAEAVEALRRAGKPVVASLGDVAASGGYYVAAACDQIVADQGTVTGSIGVIMNMINLSGIESRLGIEPEVVKSGQFKDIGSPHRAPTPEERAVLQSIIMDSYSQFVSAVAEGRHMKEAAVRKLADGRPYSGRQALALGLVDRLGSYEDAIALTQQLARARYHLTGKLPVDEGRRTGFFSALLESASGRVPAAGLLEPLLPESMSGNFARQPLWVMQ